MTLPGFPNLHTTGPTPLANVKSQPAAEASAWGRAFAFTFESPLALGLMTSLFAVTGLVLVFGHFIVQDEGLSTYTFAHWLVLNPLPVLFFQKAKPVLGLMFAVPSTGGPEALLAVHVLVAALVAPMMAAVARSMGIRAPNLAALIVLVSPLFLFGAAAGISNCEGVFAVSVFLYLTLTQRRYWLAGIVLGCMPWLRYELAPFSILLWLYMTLSERNRGVTFGAMIFPVLYAASGAMYHHDLLWLIHFGPTTEFPMPANPIWEVQRIGLRYLLVTELLVTPAIGFALAVRLSRLSRIERALVVFALASFILISFLPFLRLANFGPAARYSMQPLPIFALLSARAVEPWLDGTSSSPGRFYLLPVVLAAIWVGSSGPPAATAVPILCAYVAAAVLGSLGCGRSAVAAVVLVACIGVALPRDDMTTPVYFRPALAWLNTHAQEVRGATIYTNSPVMPIGIASSPKLVGFEVRFIVPPDMMWEINELSNPDNGQRNALQGMARTELFGRSVLWDEISPDSVAPNSLFLLRADPRLPLVLPAGLWAGRLEEIASGEFFTINRVVPSGAAKTPPTLLSPGAF